MVQAGATAPKRNADELARREHARELGSGLVLALYRLLKTSQLHSLDNMAVHQQIEQTLETIQHFSAKTSARLSVLFAKSTVFVAGQLMKGSRGDYGSALELGAMLQKLEFSEVVLAPDVSASDLRALLDAYTKAVRDAGARDTLARPSPKVRLRRVNPAVLAEDDEALTEEERIVRAYASAIVVMRRVFENLAAQRYELPHEAKRIAQKLVVLSEGDTPAFLGVTAMRNANHDAAGRAVNTSILSVAMARQLSTELAVLAKVAMAALMYDVGGSYVLDLPPPDRDQPLIIPRLTDDDAPRLPAATALVLTAMGQLHEASRIRTVIAYEAHWQRHRAMLGELYGGARNPSVAARIVATAHRFNELLTPDPGASRFVTPDEAVIELNQEARDDVDRATVALLVGAIGMFPTGSLVELTTGERGIVVRTPSHPADYARPVVRVIYDQKGEPVDPHDVDCVEDDERDVKTVLRDADERLLTARASVLAELAQAAKSPVPSSVKPASSPASEKPRWAQSVLAPNEPVTLPPVATNDVASAPPAIGSHAPPRGVASPISASEPAPTIVDKDDAPPSAPAAGTEAEEAAPPESQPGDAAHAEPATMPPPPDYEEVAGSIRPDGAPIAADQPRFASSWLQPTASGDLGHTPVPHLLVYVLDKKLTGTLVLGEEDGAQGAVYFDRGCPRRAWAPDGCGALKDLLVTLGQIPRDDLASGGELAKVADDEALLEGALLGSGRIDHDDLIAALDEQVNSRVLRLFTLPAATRYDFYASSNLLLGRCCDTDAAVGALALLTTGIREVADAAFVDTVLERLEGHVLKPHPDIQIEEFELSTGEAAVFAEIASKESSVASLSGGHAAAAVRTVVYVLMITRHLVFDDDPPAPVR